MRTVDPAVFRPRPRVESAILAPAPHRAGRRARRRASWSAPPSPTGASRWRARSSTPGRGRWPRRARRWPSSACPRTPAPRRSRPSEFAALCEKLQSCRLGPVHAIHAPAKLNLCLFLGPRREDGLHELCSLFEPLALADLIEVEDAERDEVVCEGVEGENLAALALAGAARAGLGARRRCGSRSRSGSRSRPASAAAAPTPPRSCAWPPGRVAELEQLAAEIGADVPSQLVPALALVRGAGERVARLPDPEPHAVVLLPGGGGLRDRGRLRRGRPPRPRPREPRELEALADAPARRRPAPAPRRSPTPSCSSTTSSRRRARCGPRSATRSTALRAAGRPASPLLTGSGPTAFGLFADLARQRRPPPTRTRPRRRDRLRGRPRGGAGGR